MSRAIQLGLLLLVLLLPAFPARRLSAAAPGEHIDTLARRIARDSGDSTERAQRLVTWINTEFNWTATDYQQRTVEQIIDRLGGNCAELSRVLERLLKPTGIRYRWVAEINLQPESPRRQQTAAEKVAQVGPRMSVFGLRHNDHRWLEIFDDQTKQWVPADPSIGIVGVEPWIEFRMGLGDRPQPAVPAVAEIVKDMIVPFAVVVPATKDTPAENRSDFYLIDAFNNAYDGRLATLPAWSDWVAGVRELSALAAGAFEGKVNLHENSNQIAHLAKTYDALRRQAAARGLRLSRPEGGVSPPHHP